MAAEGETETEEAMTPNAAAVRRARRQQQQPTTTTTMTMTTNGSAALTIWRGYRTGPGEVVAVTVDEAGNMEHGEDKHAA